MPGRHSRLLFLVAFALSLSVHVVLLAFVPLASHEAGAGAQEREFSVYLEPPPPPMPEPPREKIEEAPQPPPPEVALGLNAPLPPSLTWLGFTEHVPQAAPLASAEQAAFTDEPVAAAPRESDAQPAPLPAPPTEDLPPQPVEQPPPAPSPPMDTPPDVQPEEPRPSPSDNPPPDDLPQQPAQPEQPNHDVPPPDQPVEEPKPPDAPMDRSDETRTRPFTLMIVDLIDQLVQQQADQAIEHETARKQGEPDSSTPADQVNDRYTKSPTPSAHPDRAPAPPAASQPATSSAAPPSNKPVAPQPTPGASDIGLPSDKQSQPTSVIEVPRKHWELGKPLAGKGMELKPRRPTFTLLTLLTAAPGNPLCEMSFDRDGIVKRARIIKSSGDARIDEGILNSLYYWRASGEELNKLQPGELLDLQIRIMLSRRGE